MTVRIPPGAISRVDSAFRDFVAEKTSELAVSVAKELISATPVRSGHAQANWVPSVGSAHSSEEGSPTSVSTAAQSRGMAEVENYKQGDIYITNNVRYIRRLNDGHSSQAPSGFVQSSIKKGLSEAGQG